MKVRQGIHVFLIAFLVSVGPSTAFADPDSEPIECPAVGERPRTGKEVFCHARILPFYENGRLRGLRIESIQPGGFLEEIGLQAGDRVVGFNGRPLFDQKSAARFFWEVATAHALDLEVVTASGNVTRVRFRAR